MDSHEFSKLFKEILFKQLYEEIIKKLSEGENSELFVFLFKEGQYLANELEKFKLDYEKYKTGVFLWWNEDYPKIKKFIELISKNEVNFQFSCYQDMKLVVKEYYNLVNDIKNFNSQLLTEELIESKELVFKKNINPINILQQKNSLIKLLNEDLKLFVSKVNPKLEDYTNQITPEFKKYLDSVKLLLEEQISSLSTNIIKVFKGEIDEQDLQDKSKEKNKEFIELLKNPTGYSTVY